MRQTSSQPTYSYKALSDGHFMLMEAIRNGDQEACLRLLHQGISPHLRQHNGQHSALYSAAQRGNLAIVDMLWAVGAHLNAYDRQVLGAALVADADQASGKKLAPKQQKKLEDASDLVRQPGFRRLLALCNKEPDVNVTPESLFHDYNITLDIDRHLTEAQKFPQSRIDTPTHKGMVTETQLLKSASNLQK